MRSHGSFLAFGALTASLAFESFVAGCTSEVSRAGDLDMLGDGGACATTGTGSLTVNVTGLPTGVNAAVVVAGAGGNQTLTTTTTNDAAAAGSYTVSAAIVTSADPVVRVAYAATVAAANVCVTSGTPTTVAVVYSPIATSNKLWHANANSESGDLLGFASSTLLASGAPAATVATKGPGKGVAFDRQGNAWTIGAVGTDATLARFSASTLGGSGERIPDRTITLPATCLPGYGALAFDASGALWLASGCDHKVVRVAPAELEASGEVTPSIAISGIDDPQNIAFDKAGNLWVSDANSSRIRRFDASRLSVSTADVSSLTIAPQLENDADLSPGALAFDADGSLWAMNFGGNILYKLTPSDLAGTGDKSLVPSVRITLEVGALLESMAFDEGGGLFLTLSQGKIARLAPAQLGTSSNAGAPTAPQTIVASPSIGYAGGMAFFPAPAALPLYSALP